MWKIYWWIKLDEKNEGWQTEGKEREKEVLMNATSRRIGGKRKEREKEILMNKPWRIGGRRKEGKEKKEWKIVMRESRQGSGWKRNKEFFLSLKEIFVNETGRRSVGSRNIAMQRKYEIIPMEESERRHIGRRKLGVNKCKKKSEWMKLDKNM